MALVTNHLTAPLAAWLAGLPIAEGTSLERLNQILARVPAAIKRATNAVKPGVGV